MPQERPGLDSLNMPDGSSSPQLTRSPDATPAIVSPARRLKLAAVVGQYGLLIAWAVVALFFTLLPQTSETFPTANNFATIFGSQAVIVMLTLALLIPLTAGDYDLLVKFYVDNDTDIGHFINERVQIIPGIQDTHTIITFKAFGTG